MESKLNELRVNGYVIFKVMSLRNYSFIYLCIFLLTNLSYSKADTTYGLRCVYEEYSPYLLIYLIIYIEVRFALGGGGYLYINLLIYFSVTLEALFTCYSMSRKKKWGRGLTFGNLINNTYF